MRSLVADLPFALELLAGAPLTLSLACCWTEDADPGPSSTLSWAASFFLLDPVRKLVPANRLMVWPVGLREMLG